MSEQPNLINFLTQGIREHLDQLDQDAQLGRELQVALKQHLDVTRNIFIWRKHESLPYRVEVGGVVKFESVSYTACVEWALKQPMKEISNEQV